jgi:hypothetical protein
MILPSIIYKHIIYGSSVVILNSGLEIQSLNDVNSEIIDCLQ